MILGFLLGIMDKTLQFHLKISEVKLELSILNNNNDKRWMLMKSKTKSQYKISHYI